MKIKNQILYNIYYIIYNGIKNKIKKILIWYGLRSSRKVFHIQLLQVIFVRLYVQDSTLKSETVDEDQSRHTDE